MEGDDAQVKVNWQLALAMTEEIAELCPTGALEMYGKMMTVREVMEEVEKDSSFYRNTGGGMTMSGGEVMLQPDFAAALFRRPTTGVLILQLKLHAMHPGQISRKYFHMLIPCFTTLS